MSGRQLKNFDKYLQRIELYCEAVSVKLIYRTNSSDGTFYSTQRRIVIDPDLEDSTEIATLLHELGHYQDDLANDNLHKPSIINAYHNTYNASPTEKQTGLVMECEIAAWNEGEVVAKKLKIPLGKWYYKEKASALRGYRNS